MNDRFLNWQTLNSVGHTAHFLTHTLFPPGWITHKWKWYTLEINRRGKTNKPTHKCSSYNSRNWVVAEWPQRDTTDLCLLRFWLPTPERGSSGCWSSSWLSQCPWMYTKHERWQQQRNALYFLPGGQHARASKGLLLKAARAEKRSQRLTATNTWPKRRPRVYVYNTGSNTSTSSSTSRLMAAGKTFPVFVSFFSFFRANPSNEPRVLFAKQTSRKISLLTMIHPVVHFRCCVPLRFGSGQKEIPGDISSGVNRLENHGDGANRLYLIHISIGQLKVWVRDGQTVEKTRRGPQFLSPYEARYALGGPKKKNPTHQRLVHDGRRSLSTRKDLYYYCNRHLFGLVLLHSPASKMQREKKNAANTQKKNVMWNLCHSTSQCSARCVSTTRICCTLVCVHFFFWKKKAKEKGAIQKQAERWSVFRSTSFPNKRILIFLSFFLQRDMKTIFSSLCDFFFSFFPE